jgi:hypothetical protein
MLSPRLTNCPECANIPSLLKKIDCKLAELGNNLYNNISYMLNKPVPSSDILQLIGYRRILMYKYCNPSYVEKYSVQMIASKVIRLTAGCVSKCNELERCLEEPCDIPIVPNPTTTSTSTLPITTTTSTSSTTTTTTTTSLYNFDITINWEELGVTDVESFETFYKNGQQNNLFPSPNFTVNDFLMEGNRIRANVSNLFIIQFTTSGLPSLDLVSIDLIPNTVVSIQILYFNNFNGLNIDFHLGLTSLLLIYNPLISSIPTLPSTLNAISVVGCNFDQQGLDNLVDQFMVGNLPKNSWNSRNQQTGDIPSPSKITLITLNVNSYQY